MKKFTETVIHDIKSGNSYPLSMCSFYSDYTEVYISTFMGDDIHLFEGEWIFLEREVSISSTREGKEEYERKRDARNKIKEKILRDCPIKRIKMPFGFEDVYWVLRNRNLGMSDEQPIHDIFDKYHEAAKTAESLSDIENGMELEPYGFCTQDLINYYFNRYERERYAEKKLLEMNIE